MTQSTGKKAVDTASKPRGPAKEPLLALANKAGSHMLGGIKWVIRRISEMMTMFALAASCYIATASISETVSRQRAQASIRLYEQAETQNIIGQLSRDSSKLKSATNPSNSPQTEERASTTAAQMLDATFRIHAAASDARASLDELSSRGSLDGMNYVSKILHDFKWEVARAQVLIGNKSPMSLPAEDHELKINEFIEELSDFFGNSIQFQFAFFPGIMIGFMSDDNILALMVSCCALMGSVISMLREGSGANFSPQKLALGLASGFVAFLAVRGGRHVLILDMGGETPQYNPYGMAFTGLLVGLFTSRAYALLSLVVDEIEARVRMAIQWGRPTQGAVVGTESPGDRVHAAVVRGGDASALTPVPPDRVTADDASTSSQSGTAASQEGGRQ